METISYKIPGFEGPLDLLLHLVQKHKLNILDIPIAELLDQYMRTIEEWKSINLEVAAEFLEMAARLVHIKTAMLLPKHDEAEEMRRELSGELMEYQLCLEAAGRLAGQNVGGSLFVRNPAEIEPDRTYRRIHPPETILNAYLAAAGRGKRRLPPPAKAFSGIVSRRIVSVSSKIIFVLRRLYKNKKMRYFNLFEKAESRSELVATFLALLELVKACRIGVEGEGENRNVYMIEGTGRKKENNLLITERRET